MRPGDRVNMIKECATLLGARSWAEIDLVLREHGLAWTNNWNGAGTTGYDYVVDMLGGGENNTELAELHQFLLRDDRQGVLGPQPWQLGQLKLFVSHLATQAGFATSLASLVQGYGVSAFVAHTSIEPSLEWRNVIEAALSSCDAMVVLLHPGFVVSPWCDQEVGFALARKVPILPIAFAEAPHGFLGKHQAVWAGDRGAPQLGMDVVHWLARTLSAQAAFTEGLVGALEASGSFDMTRRVFAQLEKMPSLTPTQMQRLEQIPAANRQVRDAGVGQSMVPDLIRQLVISRGGGEAAKSPWDEVPF